MSTRFVLIPLLLCLPAPALAQSQPSASFDVSAQDEPKDCPAMVGDQSVDDMIAEAGSLEILHKAAVDQIAEIDKWIVEAEAAKGSGIRVSDIEAAIAEAIHVRGLNHELQLAVECRMAQ